jgi:hypothetical protein
MTLGITAQADAQSRREILAEHLSEPGPENGETKSGLSH